MKSKDRGDLHARSCCIVHKMSIYGRVTQQVLLKRCIYHTNLPLDSALERTTLESQARYPTMARMAGLLRTADRWGSYPKGSYTKRTRAVIIG